MDRRSPFALALVLLLLPWVSSADPIRFYDPTVVADRFFERFHPAEDLRDLRYFESMQRAGMNIACASAVAAYANRGLSKVFHNGSIGAGIVRFELMPNLPPHLKHGIFSDEMPKEVYGIANFTTGRWDEEPWQLKPDATGLTVGLVVNGKWVVFTTTASAGAFGRTLEDFSHLASYSAMGAMIAGGLTRRELQQVVEALRNDEAFQDRAWFPAFRRLRLSLGGALGEGAFVLRHPIAGLGTLLPATLVGRRSPFTGYADIGFGSGHAYLATDQVPLADRTAFRFGFRLADTPFSRRIRRELPSWPATVWRATVGGQHQHLTNEFNKWNELHDIELEMYVREENKVDPRRTRVESPHRGWYGPETVVARVTVLRRRPGIEGGRLYGEDLPRVIRRMPFNPGFSTFLPLGDLGYGRAAGPLYGLDQRATGLDAGAYWRSAMLRHALGMSPHGLNRAELDEGIQLISGFGARYARGVEELRP